MSGIMKATTIEKSALARKLVNMSEAQLRKLEEGKQKGLLELRPMFCQRKSILLVITITLAGR